MQVREQDADAGRQALTGDFAGLVRLERVAFLDVVEAVEQDAALEALVTSRTSSLKRLSEAMRAVVDHDAVAQQADAGVARDHAAR